MHLRPAARVSDRVGAGPVGIERMSVRQHYSMDSAVPPYLVARIQARMLIEPEIAALAANTARPGDLASLEDSVTRMAAADRQGSWDDAAERLFHTRLAQATGNSALMMAVERLWELDDGDQAVPLWERLRAAGAGRQGIADYCEMLGAVAAKDAAAARGAMARYLGSVAEALTAGPYWRLPLGAPLAAQG
jgi:DNA-binding FadR family transcriptional regulator